MRSKDKDRLAALRLILAAFKQKEVDDRITLDDHQSTAILDKMAKQHRDSIEQFGQANREDLIKKEQQELEIIESYLPEKLSENEINENSKFRIDHPISSDQLRGGGLGRVSRAQRQSSARRQTTSGVGFAGNQKCSMEGCFAWQRCIKSHRR